MKLPALIPLLAMLAIAFACNGCVFHREKKSTYHTYLGDSPTIVFGPRENAGGPVNPH